LGLGHALKYRGDEEDEEQIEERTTVSSRMDGRKPLEPGRHLRDRQRGLELSAATSHRRGAGAPADRRKISVGLLGVHAVSVTYRGKPLGSVSQAVGRDEPGAAAHRPAPTER
jgi:hypothetical protein